MCPLPGTRSVHCAVSPIVASSSVDKIRKKYRMKRTFILFIVFSLLTVVCQGRPAITPNGKNISATAVSRAIEYLSRYGYLPPSDPSTGNLRTETQLKEAISTMQIFGGLRPTGLLDRATIELTQRRRCGMPDVVPGGAYRVKRYAIQGQKWTSTNLTWSVKSQESESDIRMVRSQLRRAFEVWSSASSLTFVEVQGQSADILVSFLKGQHGDGYPFDGEGSVLAHAFFPGEGIGGDAHFDAEERWLPSQPEDEDEGVNLFAVAAHEIGHSLGLSHSSTPGSLMFPYYQMMGEYFTLPKDDAEGIRHLYGDMDLDNQPTMPTIPPPTTTPESTTTRRSTAGTKKATLKPHKTTSTPATSVPEPVDVCKTSIDAIAVIRRETFVFKGKHFWRLDMNRTLRAGYPVAINRFWSNFSSDIDRIDALYERPIDTKIMFFSGKNFWLFTANQPDPGFPRPLTDLGLPEDLERIDAAMVWGYNGKTYFFSGKEYWMFDEADGRVELDYPRRISNWRGVPPNIDAAFQWIDGSTYFFKGMKFWKFMDRKMRTESKVSSEIGGYWFNCPSRTVESTDPVTTSTMPVTEAGAKMNEAENLAASVFTLLLTFLVLIRMHGYL